MRLSLLVTCICAQQVLEPKVGAAAHPQAAPAQAVPAPAVPAQGVQQQYVQVQPQVVPQAVPQVAAPQVPVQQIPVVQMAANQQQYVVQQPTAAQQPMAQQPVVQPPVVAQQPSAAGSVGQAAPSQVQYVGQYEQAVPVQPHVVQSPAQVVQAQVHHQQAVPQQAVPQQAVPQQAVPQQVVPQQVVPQQVVPQQVVPQQVVPQQAVPQQAVPQQAVPQQAVPQAGPVMVNLAQQQAAAIAQQQYQQAVQMQHAAQIQQAHIQQAQIQQAQIQQAAAVQAQAAAAKRQAQVVGAPNVSVVDYSASNGSTGTIADEWDRMMQNFMPEMILTFRMGGGEQEHFHQDVIKSGLLIRGGFFESSGDGDQKSISFKIVAPSGKVVFNSAAPLTKKTAVGKNANPSAPNTGGNSPSGEGLFSIITEEAGTYTFAVTLPHWSKSKYVTFVVGSGETRSLSNEDISSVDGNLQLLYRTVSDIETQNSILWMRQRLQADQIKKTTNKTYYAFVIEMICTAAATLAQLSTVKRMVTKRSLF
ncbi:emp24/gp25L/p24 family protein [Gregarina niphandrodes]|uniref:Emp24/gp25L/p24 family protein n=1 Tax=Gregarina niphandrodes TaxID=110365 RepID=A0A023B2E3_GRENI|nr:emp24/gp25L/p24 family protein [Gregarina niphandrodes]EZG53716.1 emp24/gp25L/p24 family protein [Gregarina niphandrodes]|eukprot:XP_011131866.1 emp24/gp25L/p24 family protein [Gregarina niphandrodes]